MDKDKLSRKLEEAIYNPEHHNFNDEEFRMVILLALFGLNAINVHNSAKILSESF